MKRIGGLQHQQSIRTFLPLDQWHGGGQRYGWLSARLIDYASAGGHAPEALFPPVAMSLGDSGNDLTWLREPQRPMQTSLDQSGALIHPPVLDWHQSASRLAEAMAIGLNDAPWRKVAQWTGHSSESEVNKTLAGRNSTRQPGDGARRQGDRT